MLRLKRAVERARSSEQWFTQARLTLGWAVVLVLLALVGAVYLNQASQIALIGRNTQLLEEELSALQQESASIEQDIAEAQALELLYERASELSLDFVQPSPLELEYVDVVMPPESAPMTESTPVMYNAPTTIQEALRLAWERTIRTLFEGESGNG